jgi:hypothetical protein
MQKAGSAPRCWAWALAVRPFQAKYRQPIVDVAGGGRGIEGKGIEGKGIEPIAVSSGGMFSV